MSVLSEQYLQRERLLSRNLSRHCQRHHSGILEFAFYVFVVGAFLFYHVEIVTFVRNLWTFFFA